MARRAVGVMLSSMVENTTQPSDWHSYLVPIVFFVGIAVMTWSAVRLRKRAKGGATPTVASQPPVRNMDVQHMARELNGLMVDLHETAREIAAQIDNRYAKLDVMVRYADERIRKLEALQSQLAGGASTAVTVPPEQNVSAAAANRPVISADPAPSSPPTDPAHQEIYTLADSGKSARDIAQAINRPTGEVELILNLRSRTSTM